MPLWSKYFYSRWLFLAALSTSKAHQVHRSVNYSICMSYFFSSKTVVVNSHKPWSYLRSLFCPAYTWAEGGGVDGGIHSPVPLPRWPLPWSLRIRLECILASRYFTKTWKKLITFYCYFRNVRRDCLTCRHSSSWANRSLSLAHRHQVLYSRYTHMYNTNQNDWKRRICWESTGFRSSLRFIWGL